LRGRLRPEAMSSLQNTPLFLHFTAPLLHFRFCGNPDFIGFPAFSSVVGYQTQTVVGSGITWSLATFKQIDKDLSAQTLSSFALPTDQGFSSGDSIFLEIYDETGSLEGAYSFVDADNAVGYGLSKPGWYPLEKMMYWEATDDDCANDLVVPFGKGVIITSSESDTSLTFAGQVLDEAKTYDVVGGGITWTGNATPVDLTLGDLALPTDQGFSSGDSISLEIYDETGSLAGAYSFVDEDNAVGYGLSYPGWYPLEKMMYWEATDADCANETVAVPAGKMVIITSAEADTTLTLPNPME